MEIIKKKLFEIKENPKNTRIHTDKQIKELVKSINNYGAIRPIVIDEKGTILAGHGLYMALKQIGVDTADCYVLKGLSEKKKDKLLLSDNKIYELGVNDFDSIENLIKGLDGDFDIAGYDAGILEDLYGDIDLDTFDEPSASDMGSTERDGGENTLPETGTKEPSVATISKREEAMREEQNVIVCPSCGEVISLA